STRMGSEKALLAWPPASAEGRGSSTTFLQAHIAQLKRFSDLVIVVVGENRESLLPVVYASGAFAVHNPEPARGQFSSLQLGVQEVLNRGRDAALVTPVDKPPVTVTTLVRLHTEFTASRFHTWAVV